MSLAKCVRRVSEDSKYAARIATAKCQKEGSFRNWFYYYEKEFPERGVNFRFSKMKHFLKRIV